MAKVLPFGGLYYNPQKFSKIDDFLIPDVNFLTNEKRNKYLKELNNYIHLLTPALNGQEKYKMAVNKFFGWLLRDILIIDRVPSYYVLEIEISGGASLQRCFGIFGILSLDDVSNVLSIEDPDESEVAEKYSYLKEIRCILEPVTMLYEDGSSVVESMLSSNLSAMGKLFEFNVSGLTYRLYKLEDAALMSQIQNYLEKFSFYIVGGSEVFYSAMKYRDEVKSAKGAGFSGVEPSNFVLATFFNLSNEAIKLTPVSRGIKELNSSLNELLKLFSNDYKFALIKFTNPKEELIAKRKLSLILEENRRKNIISFGFYHRSAISNYLVFTYKFPVVDEFDVEVLNRTVIRKLSLDSSSLEKIVYFNSNDELFNSVKRGEVVAGFMMDGVDKSLVLDRVKKNKRFPNLSFSLFPYPITGILAYSYRYSIYDGKKEGM